MMHARLKLAIAGIAATAALFAGAAPATAATAVSIKTGKKIQSASYWDDEPFTYSDQGGCESQRTKLNQSYMGKWEGGWYQSRCVSFKVQACPSYTRWKVQAQSWYAVGGAQSVPNSESPQAVMAAASC